MQNKTCSMGTIDEIRKKAMKIYETLLRNEEYKKSGKTSDLMEFAEKVYHLLEDFKYNIGIIGAQSSGKTSVLNVLLGYPYMPVANVDTTGAVVRIKYREKLGIELEKSDGRHTAIDLEGISEKLFEELKRYACRCIKEYGVEHFNYFIAKSSKNNHGEVIVKPEDLKMEYGNLKHRVLLVLNFLLLYVDVKKDPQYLNQEVLDVIQKREELFSSLGLSETIREYSVIFYCDSPILREGLFFTDLPGMGSDGENHVEGEKTNEQVTLAEAQKVDAMMLVMMPKMSADDRRPLRNILPIFAGRKITNTENKLIPVMNKIDLAQGGYRNKVDELYKESNLELNSEHTIGVSAFQAEKRIFDLNQELPLEKSNNASALPKVLRKAENIRSLMEENYEMSNFDTIYGYISTYLPKAVMAESLQLMIYVYQEISSIVTLEKAALDINEQFMRSSGEISGETIKTLGSLVSNFSSKQAKEYREILDVAFTNFLSNKISAAKQDEYVKMFKSLIDSDQFNMSGKVRDYGNKLLQNSNMIGDIVLSRKNGRDINEENTRNWNGLKNTVLEANCEKAFSYLQASSGDLDEEFTKLMLDKDQEFERVMKKFREELVKNLHEKKQDVIRQSVQGIVSAAGRGQLSNPQNYQEARKVALYLEEYSDAKEDGWMEHRDILEKIAQSSDWAAEECQGQAGADDKFEEDIVTAATLEMIDMVITKVEEVLEDIAHTIETSSGARNEEIEKKRDEILAEVMEEKINLEQEYKKRNIEFLESIVGKGVFFTKTELIPSNQLSAALNGKLDFSAQERERYSEMAKKLFTKLVSGYEQLLDKKKQDIMKVSTVLYENLGELTGRISGYAVENESRYQEEIAQEKSLILAFEVDETMDGWFEGFEECPDFLGGFTKEIEEIQQLHRNLMQIQSEVGA